MFNPITTYEHAGKMAGKAARNHDMATVRHWSDWARRAYYLETAEDRVTARHAYNKAYTDHARG